MNCRCALYDVAIRDLCREYFELRAFASSDESSLVQVDSQRCQVIVNFVRTLFRGTPSYVFVSMNKKRKHVQRSRD